MHIKEFQAILEGIIRNYKCGSCNETPDFKNLNIASMSDKSIKMQVNCEKCGLSHSITAGFQDKDEIERQHKMKMAMQNNPIIMAMAIGAMMNEELKDMHNRFEEEISDTEYLSSNIEELETYIQQGTKAEDIFGESSTTEGEK